MCDPVTMGLMTVASAGASVMQGVSGYRAGQQQAALYGQQAQTEAELNATQAEREGLQFDDQIGQQRAELAARGIQLDSVTAVMLGRQAATEKSFQIQSTRAQGQATQAELTNAQAVAQADAMSSLLGGFSSAAGSVISLAPDIWPSLLSGGS